MGLHKTLPLSALTICVIVASSPCYAEEMVKPEECKPHVLYLMSTRQVDRAISQYLTYYQTVKKHDFVLLEQIASMLLESGIASSDPEEQLLAMFAWV